MNAVLAITFSAIGITMSIGGLVLIAGCLWGAWIDRRKGGGR